MKKRLIFLLALCLLVLAGCRATLEDGPVPEEATVDWGITMTVENVTPTGCTLKVTQSGGNVTGSLGTGYSYFMTKQTPLMGWKECAMLTGMEVPASILWIELDSTAEWELSWELYYGALEPGKYRICKVFTDYVDRKVEREQTLWTEFTVQ